MATATQEQLDEAKQLLKAKHYDEAREILTELNHPTARRWLAKLDEIAPIEKATTPKQKNIPTEPERPRKSASDRLIEQAEQLIEKEEYDEARELLEPLRSNLRAAALLASLPAPVDMVEDDYFNPDFLLEDDDDDDDLLGERLGATENTRNTSTSSMRERPDNNHGASSHPYAVESKPKREASNAPNLREIYTDEQITGNFFSRSLSSLSSSPREVKIENGQKVIYIYRGPGVLMQVIYFTFTGWWLGWVWAIWSWIFTVSIIGMPLGLWMFQYVTKVLFLAPPRKTDRQGNKLKQRNIFVRGIYFILIGWWFSFWWMQFAYFFSVLVFLWPIGYWMMARIPMVVTLQRV